MTHFCHLIHKKVCCFFINLVMFSFAEVCPRAGQGCGHAHQEDWARPPPSCLLLPGHVADAPGDGGGRWGTDWAHFQISPTVPTSRPTLPPLLPSDAAEPRCVSVVTITTRVMAFLGLFKQDGWCSIVSIVALFISKELCTAKATVMVTSGSKSFFVLTVYE